MNLPTIHTIAQIWKQSPALTDCTKKHAFRFQNTRSTAQVLHNSATRLHLSAPPPIPIATPHVEEKLMQLPSSIHNVR